MKKLVTALAFFLLTCWIGLAFCNRLVYAGPTAPPSPPVILINVESVDCESIKFLVEIQPRNHVLSYFLIKYRIGDSATVIEKKIMLIKTPDGFYQSVFHVVVADLPPDTVIHYWAVLVYTGGTVETPETAAQTDPLPVISVNLTHVYSEGFALTLQISPNGNDISDVRVEYYTPTSHDWSAAVGEEISTNVYVISINDLSPQISVHYWGAINYLTHQGVRYLALPESEITTNALPSIRVTDQVIGFVLADILVDVRSNNNPIYGSYLEYQLPEISEEWKTYSNTAEGSESFVAYLVNLVPNQTILFRGGLTYMTGGLTIYKVIQTDTYVVQTNSVTTGDYQSDIHADNITVDYHLNGNFNYSKRTPDVFTHFDLGFVWSENSNPILNENAHQLSLGASSLPVDYIDASYAFSASAIGLKTGVKYYYRAYVIGENNQVFYGEVKPIFMPKMTPGATTTGATTSGTSSSETTQTIVATTTNTGENTATSATSQTTTSSGQTSASTSDATTPGQISEAPGTTESDVPTGSSANSTTAIVILVVAVLALAGGTALALIKRAKNKGD